MPHPASDPSAGKKNIRAELWVQPLWIPTKASGGRPGWETSKCRLRDRGGLEGTQQHVLLCIGSRLWPLPSTFFSVGTPKWTVPMHFIQGHCGVAESDSPHDLWFWLLEFSSLTLSRNSAMTFDAFKLSFWFLLSFSGLQSILAKRLPDWSNKAAVKHPKTTCPAHLHVDETIRGHPGCNQNAWGWNATDFGHVWISYCQWILKETLWYNITQSPSTNNLC